MLRATGLFGLAFVIFAAVLLAAGKDPIRAYRDILSSTLVDRYGFSVVLVKMIPLMLTALAVAIPSRICLINIGEEAPLYMGALVATLTAAYFAVVPAWEFLPLV